MNSTLLLLGLTILFFFISEIFKLYETIIPSEEKALLDIAPRFASLKYRVLGAVAPVVVPVAFALGVMCGIGFLISLLV